MECRQGSIGTMLHERNVRREFYALLKQQNLPRIRSHDLRHSCATSLLAAGEQLNVVEEMLGHSSVQLMLDTYRHLVPDLKKEIRENATVGAIANFRGSITYIDVLFMSTMCCRSLYARRS